MFETTRALFSCPLAWNAAMKELRGQDVGNLGTSPICERLRGLCRQPSPGHARACLPDLTPETTEVKLSLETGISSWSKWLEGLGEATALRVVWRPSLSRKSVRPRESRSRFSERL